MKRLEAFKKAGVFLMAGVIACSSFPANAEGADMETAGETAEAGTEDAGENQEAEAPQIPEVTPLEGEKTETASGVLEKISRDVVVEEENKGKVEFIVYTPSGIRPVGPSTPVIIVYGDSAVTVRDAESVLESSGLDDIAKEVNCSVVFVNPVGDTWEEADAEAYLYSLVDIFSEDTGSGTGKNAAGDKLIGTSQRIYVIAEGKGADFTAQYLAKETMKKFFVFTDFHYVPAGIMLFNPSVQEASCSIGMPAVIGGGSTELVGAFKEMNSTDAEEPVDKGTLYTNSAAKLKNFMSAEVSSEGFDKDIIRSGWDNVLSKVRRQLSGIAEESYELLPVYDYTEYGIQVNIETADINGKPMEWYEYIPEDIDMSAEGSVPLVFTFHGGGNHAEYQVIASEWPLVGKENGFMVVAVNQHVERTADEIVELLKILENNYPAIDKTRVYASGFSMGSIKSFDLGLQYPELFAGIAPMDASGVELPEMKDSIIPVYYLAGIDDGLPVFPHQAGFGHEDELTETGEVEADFLIQRLFAMNKIEYPGYDAKADPVWGMEFTETIEKATANPVHTITENYMASQDGNTYTVFATMSNQAHAVLAGSSYAAWDFLKQFSRNEDGSITVSE